MKFAVNNRTLFFSVALTTASTLGSACGDERAKNRDDGDGGASSGVGMTTGGEGGQGGAASLPPDDLNCFDYVQPAAFARNVSFAGDVMPLFQARCAKGMECHSKQAPTPDGGLVLGSPQGAPSQTEIHGVYAAIVNIAAKRAPAMKLVAPGDPAGSFLLAKTEYSTVGSCVSMCVATGCGNRMPTGIGAQPLSELQRQILRGWIRDGALEN
jgi:hypothetical protein